MIFVLFRLLLLLVSLVVVILLRGERGVQSVGA